MQRLVLFDMDNTLIDLDGAFGAWAAEFADAHGLGDDGVRWLLDLDIPHRDLMFRWIKYHFDLVPSADELWAAYRARMPFLVECRPEVLAMLARLRAAGWKVGIVANGMADNQLGKLRATGLADAVDGFAVAGVEGIRKPDVALFEIAAKRCGAALAGGGWMVGDNHAADIEGGRAAGLRTIWITRELNGSEADHVVADVLESEALIWGD
ncbi:HAD family hydrolase [Herbidospora daliensis]|uniref:HAD family hydrolase n=1 Tax=Herbidospora daliensis TaxID=295585 RepID=UPI000781A7A3|nr:HAD family hydrolase [Herbidospora daliensis]